MSLRALPLLFLNMGGEMLYILDQRLKAQNIAADKTIKVLHDIIQTLLNKKFLDELFRPQQVYPKKALRSVFERLAHSSIMRLNTSSMDKLYDLMVMAVKYQTLLCQRPQDLLLVTLNHLDVVRSYAEGSKQTQEQTDYTYELLYRNYASLNPGSFMLIRQTLLDFFQDTHIRVSIFLRDKVQHNTSGRFIIPTSGQLPHGVEIPGKIRLYVPGGDCVKTIEFKTGAGAYSLSKKEGSCDMFGDRVTPLGTNMYSAVRVTDTNVSHVTSTSTTTTYTDYDPSASDPKARAQLDLLCQLIGGGASSHRSKHEFRLDFLNHTDDDLDDDDETGSVISSAPVLSASANNVFNIDASKSGHNVQLSRIMGDLNIDSTNQTNDDNLLDLMDSIQ